MKDNRSLFVAGIRIAVGAGLVVAPAFAVRTWAGRSADTPSGRMLARAIGGRDLVLGALLLKALRADERHDHLLQLGLAADAVDILAATLMGSDLGRSRRLVVPLVAGGVAAAGYLAGKAIDES